MDALQQQQQQQQQQYGGVPLYPCPAFAAVSRPPRCSYDPAALAGRALVIDNGSHTMRAGWAGEESPSVVFRSAMCKPRPRQGPALRAVVGEWGPGLSGWDFGKHTHRYCFESDVPTNMEAQEALTDWALDRMGLAAGGCVDHPLLMTEAPLMPGSARSQLAQLLFEAYGVPALSFVAAAPAAFYHHHSRHHLLQQQCQNGWAGVGLQQPDLLHQNGNGMWQEACCGSSNGLVVCSGHSSTYVVAVYKGQPQWGAAVRCWAGGAACTSHLQQLLFLQAPQHAGGLLGNWQLVEALKEGFCVAAGDYRQQLRAVADQPATAGGLAVRVQLPFVPPAAPTKPSPLDLAVRAQEAKARGKALAEQRRLKVLEEKEEQLAALLELQDGATAGGAATLGSREDLARQVAELAAEVDRLRGQLPRTTPPPAAAAAAAAAADAMGIDAAPGTAAEAAATSAGAAADSAAAAQLPTPAAAAAAAATAHTAGPGTEADTEHEEGDDAAAEAAAAGGADDDSSATVSEGALHMAGTAAAAAAAARGAAAAAGPAAAAAGCSSAAGVEDAGSDAHSSSTVTDEGLCEQEALMQEVLQQVNHIRKQQRQQQPPPPQQQQQQVQQAQWAPPPQPAPALNPEEINYLGIPDNMLTADQLKIKRRQQLLQAGRLARERAAARKLQQQRKREAQLKVEDQQLHADPFSYLQQLQQRHSSAAARVEARKRRRLGAAVQHHQGEGEECEQGGQGLLLATGRAARRDERHRERMRLIAQAAAPAQRKPTKEKGNGKRGRAKADKRGGGRGDRRDGRRKGSAAAGGGSSESEEGFGDDGADWEVYRAMDMRGSDSDVAAAEEAELNWTSQRLQQIGAAVAAAATATLAAAAAAGSGSEAGAADAAAAAADAAAGETGDTAMPDAAAAAAAVAPPSSSRAVSQEPQELPDAAGAGGADAAGNLLELAAAAVAGQLCTLAYPAADPLQAAAAAQVPEALAGLDLTLLGLGGLGFGEVLGAGQGSAPAKLLTAEDYQLLLGVERVRVPELLMQPAALAGVDQAGLPEVVGLVLRRLPKAVAEAVAAGGVVVTGGNTLFPGLLSRLQAELAALRPPDKPMPIWVSSNPLLDTWRGAAALAAATGRSSVSSSSSGAAAAGAGGSGCWLFGDPFAAGSGALSRAAYEEAGVDYLREFRGFKYPDL